MFCKTALGPKFCTLLDHQLYMDENELNIGVTILGLSKFFSGRIYFILAAHVAETVDAFHKLTSRDRLF